MSTPGWPNKKAAWDPSVRGRDNEALWQQGISDGLVEETLRLEPRLAKDVYDLVGQCPRCGHDMHDDVHFRVVGPFRKLREVIGSIQPSSGDNDDEEVEQNIECDCAEPHAERPEGKRGCGWAPLLAVSLRRPKATKEPAHGE